jgi:phosphoribosyl-AMP cyclohydrolase
MQKNCFVNLFNKDSEEHKMFSIKISDFWYKNKISGRFVTLSDIQVNTHRPL